MKDFSNLSIEDIENELKRETYKTKYNKILRSTIYTLIIVVAVATIIVSLVMPVVEISGSSMTPKLYEGDNVDKLLEDF